MVQFRPTQRVPIMTEHEAESRKLAMRLLIGCLVLFLCVLSGRAATSAFLQQQIHARRLRFEDGTHVSQLKNLQLSNDAYEAVGSTQGFERALVPRPKQVGQVYVEHQVRNSRLCTANQHASIY